MKIEEKLKVFNCQIIKQKHITPLVPCISNILENISWYDSIIDMMAKCFMLSIYIVNTLHTVWDISSQESCKWERLHKKVIQLLEVPSVNFLSQFKLKSWWKSKGKGEKEHEWMWFININEVFLVFISALPSKSASSRVSTDGKVIFAVHLVVVSACLPSVAWVKWWF